MVFNGCAFENPITPKGSLNLCYANSGQICYKNELCKSCKYLSLSHLILSPLVIKVDKWFINTCAEKNFGLSKNLFFQWLHWAYHWWLTLERVAWFSKQFLKILQSCNIKEIKRVHHWC